MNLNTIRDNLGARSVKTRVGRGEGSGIGKTCGKGVKGQKARSGVSIAGFEGGQNPLYMRLPKRGFKNIFRKEYEIINLDQLQKAIEKNVITASQQITIDTLKDIGLVRRSAQQIKVLGTGHITSAINLHVTKATQSAVKAIEAAKGTITQTAIS